MLRPTDEAHVLRAAIPGAEALLLEGAQHPAYHERLVAFVR